MEKPSERIRKQFFLAKKKVEKRKIELMGKHTEEGSGTITAKNLNGLLEATEVICEELDRMQEEIDELKGKV